MPPNNYLPNHVQRLHSSWTNYLIINLALSVNQQSLSEAANATKKLKWKKNHIDWNLMCNVNENCWKHTLNEVYQFKWGASQFLVEVIEFEVSAEIPRGLSQSKKWLDAIRRTHVLKLLVYNAIVKTMWSRGKLNYFTLLGPHKYVGHIFVFAQQRQMEKNFQRFGISSHDNELSKTTVQCLCS